MCAIPSTKRPVSKKEGNPWLFPYTRVGTIDGSVRYCLWQEPLQAKHLPVSHSIYYDPHGTLKQYVFYLCLYKLELRVMHKQFRQRRQLARGKVLSQTMPVNLFQGLLFQGLHPQTKKSKTPTITVSDIFMCHTESECGNSPDL